MLMTTSSIISTPILFFSSVVSSAAIFRNNFIYESDTGLSPLLFKVKIPGNIKSEIDITLTPGTRRLGEILRRDHALRIAEYQLENVAAGLYIPTQGKRIVYGGRHHLSRRDIIVFCVDAHPFCDLQPSAHAQCKDIILIFNGGNQVVVQISRGYLQRKSTGELAGDKQLAGIGRTVFGIQIRL